MRHPGVLRGFPKELQMNTGPVTDNTIPLLNKQHDIKWILIFDVEDCIKIS